MTEEISKELKTLREMIQGARLDNSDWTDIKGATLEVVITDLEISQIEDEQMLTDHDIAIMELQAGLE